MESNVTVMNCTTLTTLHFDEVKEIPKWTSRHKGRFKNIIFKIKVVYLGNQVLIHLQVLMWFYSYEAKSH